MYHFFIVCKHLSQKMMGTWMNSSLAHMQALRDNNPVIDEYWAESLSNISTAVVQQRLGRILGVLSVPIFRNQLADEQQHPLDSWVWTGI